MEPSALRRKRLPIIPRKSVDLMAFQYSILCGLCSLKACHRPTLDSSDSDSLPVPPPWNPSCCGFCQRPCLPCEELPTGEIGMYEGVGLNVILAVPGIRRFTPPLGVDGIIYVHHSLCQFTTLSSKNLRGLLKAPHKHQTLVACLICCLNPFNATLQTPRRQGQPGNEEGEQQQQEE